MICTQVIGEDAAVAFAGAQGQLQLNVMRPIVINNFLHSARILADGAGTFRRYTIEGTELNRDTHRRAAGPLADAGHGAGADGRLRQGGAHRARGACERHDPAGGGAGIGAIDAETFDRVVDARAMV